MDAYLVLLMILAFVCGYFVQVFAGKLVDKTSNGRHRLRSRSSRHKSTVCSTPVVYERGGGSAGSAPSITTESNTSILSLTHVPATPIVTPVLPKVVPPLSSALTVSTPSGSAEYTSTSSNRSPHSERGSLIMDPWRNEDYRGLCHCGNAGLVGDEADYLPPPNPQCPYPIINRAVVMPINFEKYIPLNLTDLTDSTDGDSLGLAATTSKVKPYPNVCTAFHPTLHAVYFAHHYAFLLNELVENYEYLG